jgi:hypothetical protein
LVGDLLVIEGPGPFDLLDACGPADRSGNPKSHRRHRLIRVSQSRGCMLKTSRSHGRALQAIPYASSTVCVETVTRTRDHHIDESFFHTRVEVEHVPIGRPVAAVRPTREEGDTTILSVFEEIIFIERRLILKEKVHTCRVHVAQRYQDAVAVRELTVEISRGGSVSRTWR